MVTKIDKRDRAAEFRARLTDAIDRTGSNRSALARDAGVDRSTIAQLLSNDGARMPGGNLVADCAMALGVSADWLLGLTDRPERPGDVVAQALSVADAERTMADDQIMEWHREAAGYKIRHVPATLPDVLKTEAVLDWEYNRALARTPEQAKTAMNDRYTWLREQISDYEIAMPISEFAAFAAGAGYYASLPVDLRKDQLETFAREAEDGYPSLRLHLFDSRRVFSAPVTIFGPMLAAIYVGHFYLAIRSKDRVRLLTRHFDQLIREAVVEARDFADHVRGLSRDL